MKLYEVKITTMYIGMRIEDFDCDCFLFKDKEKALQKAYTISINNLGEDLLFNNFGNYSSEEDSGYGWKEYECLLREVNLDLDKDIIFSTSFSSY
jgi:hypothetical protein